MAEEKVHCFEAAGLGKAPFKYVGMVHQEISYGQRVVGSVGGVPITTKPGGTCDYCGTYIVNMFRIRSADDREFKVGCDCLAKVGELGLKKRADNDLRVEKKLRKMEAQQVRVQAAKDKLPQVRGLLAEQPHPNPYMASQGKTLLDWVNWVLQNTNGLAAARVIEQQ